MSSTHLTLFVFTSSFCFVLTTALYKIDDSIGLGRSYDGIGGLSGGSGTSKLLKAYPEKQRNEILDYMFKPNFAGSMQILKVEIGGDSISADATEGSHMHYSWDENYQRGYEWWMMKEAKKRNPDIKLYGLPWNFPGWLGHGTQDPYKTPEVLAMYIRKWVQGARDFHNLTIDYIGIWNERPFNINYIKVLRKVLDESGFSHVRIVAADIEWGIEKYILKDSALASAIDIIGVHYPRGATPMEAFQTGKTFWASEDYSAPNKLSGGMLWGKVLNENYVDRFMTSTIAWNLIDSYYEGLRWDRDSLMTARQPWSGFYIVESPIWMTAHRTQFTQIGWKYLRHGSGVGHLDGNQGTYMSLTSPDFKHLTIVIETVQSAKSNSSDQLGPTYTKNASIPINLFLGGSFASTLQLYVWYSKFQGSQSVFFKQLDPKKVKNGLLSFSMGPNEVYTLTTLNTGRKGDYGTPPPYTDFPLPYTEDFQSYAENEEPLLLAPQNGYFEVVKGGAPHGNIMRQMVTQLPVVWKGCKTGIVNYQSTMNLLGSQKWSDVYVEVDIRVSKINGTNGVYVGALINNTGCEYFIAHGVFFFIYPANKSYIVSSDFGRSKVLSQGAQSIASPFDWNTVALHVKNGLADGWINKKHLFTVKLPAKPASGFVAVGTSNFGLADFDNLKLSQNMDKHLKESSILRKFKNHDQSINRDDRLYYMGGWK